MKSSVWLDITQEDIENGKRKDAYACPIARALKRALGSQNEWGVQVAAGKYRWEAFSPNGVISIGGKLPIATKNFVNKWDKGNEVVPQRLRLWMGE